MDVIELLNNRKKPPLKPSETALRYLPDRECYIYGRISSPGQIRDSHESIRQIASLVKLAKSDGYLTSLVPERVEEWLVSIANGIAIKGVMKDREVTVDVQDLGLSGQLSGEQRSGLANLQIKIEENQIGAVYLTEGVSRLSRDKDRILPYQLLKSLKEHQVRIRTPEGVWNPANERDWDYLAEEFEDAIGELKVMNRRMYRRKAQKAQRGEFVGGPVTPGAYLTVIGRRPNGQYEYGKQEPYPPHAEVVQKILEEFVRQGGGGIRTKKGLKDLVFPFFPTELSYMERLSALRTCHKSAAGYNITPTLIHNLAINLKLIGIWTWGNQEPILGNHKHIISEQLFLRAYNLATSKHKKRGKATYFEPMEWSGLLWCNNGREPRLISSHNAEGRYVCDRDYHLGEGSICLDIEGRFINSPLTSAVLSQIRLDPLIEEVLMKLENEAIEGKLELIRRGHQKTRLEQEILKWQELLPYCVSSETGVVDREKEIFYWEQIRRAQGKLQALKVEPISSGCSTSVDFVKIREFLRGINEDWNKYSVSLRNRLLSMLISKVELSGNNDIKATIYWKTGLQQQVLIHRPAFRSSRNNRWNSLEDTSLMKLFPSSSPEVVMAALPNRSWSSITLRAMRLRVKRKRQYHPPERHKPWTVSEDDELRPKYISGLPLKQISQEINRSVDAIQSRASSKGLKRPESCKRKKAQIEWEFQDFIPSQIESSGR